MERYHFDCQCSDFQHSFRFTLDPEDGEVWLDVHLANWLPWYKRVWAALRYVFKCDRAYGHYDVTILRDEDYDRLRDLLRRSEIAKAGSIGRAREQLIKG